jgi:hypothetical protein
MSDASTPTSYESPQITESATVIYAWQVDDATHGWNIVGMQMPNGVTMPMVTSRFDLAWQTMEIAQEHANRTGRNCRLAVFAYSDLIALVEPER